MREIIEQVVEAEAEARRIDEQAQSEALRRVADAQAEAARLLEAAEGGARAEVQTLLRTAREHAEQDKQRRVALGAQALRQRMWLSAEAREAAVLAVLRAVCGTDVSGTAPHEEGGKTGQ